MHCSTYTTCVPEALYLCILIYLLRTPEIQNILHILLVDVKINGQEYTLEIDAETVVIYEGNSLVL